MDLSILRRTAAEIAAAAVNEIYPNVELWGGGETPLGFYYDIHVSYPIQLEVIEERMRQIVRERRPIRTHEMVAFSASELLKSKSQTIRAEAVEEDLVELIQIGDFYDLSPGPHLKNTAELAAFKIALEMLPDQGVRIVGWCHRSKEELKNFLKKLDKYIEPQKLGEQMGLWRGNVWLPQGLKMRQVLTDFLKREWWGEAFEISGPLDADRNELHRSMGKAKVAEAWVTSQETHLQISFFDQSEQDLISCLHSIGKTLTILGFDHSTVPVGQGTDYVVEDGIGRSHPIVQIKRISRKGSPRVDFIVETVVERMLSLILEKNLMMVVLENQ